MARPRQSYPIPIAAERPPEAVFELARALARKMVADQDRARKEASR